MTSIQAFRYGEANFASAMSKLVHSSSTNPIYAPQFGRYYQECANSEGSNNSIVVVHNMIPIVALVFSLDSKKPQKVSYFGLPSQLLVSKNSNESVLDEALVLLLQELSLSGVSVNNGKISNNFRMEIDPTSLSSKRIEKMFFSNTEVELRFDRILKISSDPEKEYSKSVKHALKKADLNIEIISSETQQNEIASGLSSLKRLHFQSAGKTTRSEQSWQYQKEMIQNSDAILVQGSYQNQIVTSALFMINESAAFYAVSASLANHPNEGLSHLLVDHAIRNLTAAGISEIWLGEQHSDALRSIPLKEKQIEVFKGFFGGHLQTHLIASTR